MQPCCARVLSRQERNLRNPDPCEPRKNCAEPVKPFIRCDERSRRAQSCLCFRNCTITKPKRPCNLELPPQVVKSAKQFASKVGHPCPESKAIIREKISGIPPGDLQLDGLQISAEVLCSHSSIRRCGQSNPLGKLARAVKHQRHDQIARWILMAPVAAVANFKTDHGNLNCT